jgi:hypothetical protein
VRSGEKLVAKKWYRLTAQWDGHSLTLDVNGKRHRVTRSGIPQPKDASLAVGGHGGWIDNLTIENPRLPTLTVSNIRQEHAILCAGRPETLVGRVRNLGMAAEQVTAQLRLPPNTRCLGASEHELGALPMGAERIVKWTIQADAPTVGAAEIRITAAGARRMTARHPLAVFTADETLPPFDFDQPQKPKTAETTAATYYVDSLCGSNSNDGMSPASAWRDFTNINGRILGPGEKLLIRRGSVLNQELDITAHGTADHWAEIGAYGIGPRPTIRRNWDIDDRCALVRNPDFLRIRSLVVCHAAKGLIIHFSEPYHQGLLIEDCIAHHIEGLYRPNAHGIPEWRDRNGPTHDGVSVSAGIAVTGRAAKNLLLKDCESFQCSSGYFVSGQDVTIDRYFCHDNFVHNTSPHPFLVTVRRAVLQNSIFDASGWHASAGTMGIMLGNPQGLIIRNCYFQNQPDSGSHDEGGIDFENSGNGCLIDHCTFENNAGAAIEVLGLRSPQTTNIEIRDSRFIKNNTANQLGPSEIFVWGRTPDPSVCCSSGTILDNGYVTLPDVKFFVNEAPKLTSWSLRDNSQFSTIEEIEGAMPHNRPPVVDAGDDIRTNEMEVVLTGNVADDGKPAGHHLSVGWEVLEGAGEVAFEDRSAARTRVSFDQPGDYLLRLVGDDGELWVSDNVVVHVLPASTSFAAAFEFNATMDKEGWTEINTGSQVQHWDNPTWPTTSHPVKYAAGGYYIVAIENSQNASLLSPDHLGVDLTGRKRLRYIFKITRRPSRCV